jgi:hypothetical protein
MQVDVGEREIFNHKERKEHKKRDLENSPSDQKSTRSHDLAILSYMELFSSKEVEEKVAILFLADSSHHLKPSIMPDQVALLDDDCFNRFT